MITATAQKNQCQLWGEALEQISFTQSAFSLKKINYIILDTVYYFWLKFDYMWAIQWLGKSEEGGDG